jgi:hypothetical protein
VLLQVRLDNLRSEGADLTMEEQREFMQPTLEKYETEGNAYYATAQLRDDGIIDPLDTRMALGLGISASLNAPIPDTRSVSFGCKRAGFLTGGNARRRGSAGDHRSRGNHLRRMVASMARSSDFRGYADRVRAFMLARWLPFELFLIAAGIAVLIYGAN